MRLDKLTVKAEEALQAAQSLAAQLDAAIEKMPQVRGGSGQYIGERLRATLDRAQKQAESMKDEYVSTEHLLVAIAQDRDGAASHALAAAGVTPDAIFKALVDLRGTQRVTDQNPE